MQDEILNRVDIVDDNIVNLQLDKKEKKSNRLKIFVIVASVIIVAELITIYNLF